MIQHFQEVSLTAQRPLNSRLSDAEFSQALDHLVIACTDIVLLHQRQVLLAQRNQYPRKDWWMIGGRMQVGEAPLDAAIRKLNQETNLGKVAHNRLQFVGAYSTAFQHRNQPPQSHGLHSLNLTYRLELTATERETLVLTPSEYSAWQWFNPVNLVQQFSQPQAMDLALLRVVQDCLPSGF